MVVVVMVAIQENAVQVVAVTGVVMT